MSGGAGVVSLARTNNPADIEWALAEDHGPLLPAAGDREAWEDLAARPGSERTAQVLRAAEKAAAAGVPTISATLYLDYSRTGSRERHREPFKARRAHLAQLALAECIEYEGRFLDPILDLAWAICEESSWALPAHQVELSGPEESMLDLTSAMTALDLAELVVLLGERLEPGLAARIYDEIDRRCFSPYLYRNDHHWLYDSSRHGVNNWAAVCNAGVVGAALHLEPDPRRTAQIVYKGLRSLDDYLATFTADGGSSEGPGYWTYGFGYFTILSDLLERATGGTVDLLRQSAKVSEVARYPLRTVLEPGSYVTFSDTDPRVRYWRPLLEYLGRKLDLPEVAELGVGEPVDLPELDLARSLRSLLWRYQEGEAQFVPGPRDWLPDLQWMIARQDPGVEDSLVLAVKGGHNGEMHNHNDVGNIIVRSGGENLLTDLGRGPYTRKYFSPERYQVFVRSSLGHSVPVVNGRAQGPNRFEMKSDARKFAARLIERRTSEHSDELELELAAAYGEEAGLESLSRVVALERDERRVRLVDSFTFRDGPGSFESVLITLGEVSDAEGCLIITGEKRGLRLELLDAGVEVEIDSREGVELAHAAATVRRIVLRHPAARQGRVEILLTPLDVGALA